MLRIRVHYVPTQQVVYQKIADEAEACLHEHVLEQWFPRSVDGEHGGFNQEFREDWSQAFSHSRGIVYQSRLTWVTAKASIRYPDPGLSYKTYSNHGVNCLCHKMWDHSNGGYYWSLTDSGTPLPWKHTYGISFAIYALAANFGATGSEVSLAKAIQSFNWLEKHAHDNKNLGYYEALRLNGKPFLSAKGAPDSVKFGQKPGTDAIGTLYGLKSMNTHIHLLEAFSELYTLWPDPQLRVRLQELFELIRKYVVHPDGYLHLYFQPNWEPVEAEDSYGHDIETAYLLVEAAHVLGMSEDPEVWLTAKKIVDHTLNVAWDKTYGGIFREGDHHSGPATAKQMVKGWWEQAEALNALLLMHEHFGNGTERYWNAFTRQWDFIKNHQLDRTHKGWYHEVSREGIHTPGEPKSDGWTDPYHQGRALINVTDRLRSFLSDD